MLLLSSLRCLVIVWIVRAVFTRRLVGSELVLLSWRLSIIWWSARHDGFYPPGQARQGLQACKQDVGDELGGEMVRARGRCPWGVKGGS